DKMHELQDKIAFFEDRDFVLAEKKKALDELYDQAYSLAQNMSEERKEKAKILEDQIMDNARDLMLPNVSIKIMIDEVPLSSNGIDDVEFYVSMNKGEELKPLRNAASGGEISRLMLALKAVFTALSETSLAIFDEIDTGVSGKVALSIGQKIAQIAETTQVLCITHLAAVAACAKEHFYIYKTDDEAYSNTSVRKLDYDQIINELAVISTSEVSESSVSAAKELYKTAQESLRR
ncbi:MAG: DNA repair protein RecN, partial [Erysipelotrichaceae bacterium]|nr:DNA repair protein RecN [Erysipelotrichaceae bacterium]